LLLLRKTILQINFFSFLFYLQKYCAFALLFLKNYFLFSFSKNLVLRTSIFDENLSPRWGEPLSDKRRSRVPEAPCIGRV